MFGLGIQEILLILAVVLLIFGHKKLPAVGSGMGRAIRNFKRALSEPDQIDITPNTADTTEKVKKTESETEK